MKSNFIRFALLYIILMSKSGKAKNTQNKAKHTKLMNRKKNKIRDEKILRKEKLKELNRKINEEKNI